MKDLFSKFTGVLIVLCCAMTLDAEAQKTKLLSSENHLSNSLINQILQTSDGYAWIATEDGLNRYDGQSIKVYRAGEGQGKLMSNYVQRLFEDRDHRLLVGCISGLQAYDKSTDSFTTIPLLAAGDTVQAHVTGIEQDSEGNIWVATSGRGLMKMEGDHAVTTDFFPGIRQIDFISSIMLDSQMQLWIVAHKNGVFHCNTLTGEVAQAGIANDLQLAENDIVEESLGSIYLNVSDALYVYDEDRNTFVPSGFAPDNEHFPVAAIGTYDGQTLVGTDGNGLFLFDRDMQRTERLVYYAPQIEFDKTKIHSIASDSDGNLWLGLFQKGVLIAVRESESVVSLGFRPGGKFNIGSGCVTSILCQGNDTWVGIDCDGLYRVEKDGGTEHIKAPVPKTVMAIEPASDGGLWLAAYNEGLVHYDGRETVREYNEPLTRISPDFNYRVMALKTDKKGRLWVGTFGYGLFCMQASGAVKSYASTSEQIDYSRNEPVNNWTNAICTDGDLLWIGTYRGISLFSTDEEQFLRPDDELLTAIGQSVVYSIEKSADAKLWFGTNKGLVVYDTQSRQATVLTTENGLVDNTVVSLRSDNAGNVWGGTHNGLSRINTTTFAIENFSTSDGLTSNEFSRGAVDIDDDGRFYFGSTNGISRFFPATLQQEQDSLRLELTQFFLNGTQVDSQTLSGGFSVINRTEQGTAFRFSAEEKSFTASFSTFRFDHPENVVLRYRLSGYDNRWQTTSPGVPQVSFTNLPHGQYELEVQAQLGKSRSPLLVTQIEIMPMWWQSWWAYILYGLILLGIAVTLSIIASSRRRLNEELLEQQHKRDIDEAKFQFFYNISHEIRTPLTLIINPISELLSNEESTPKQRKSYRLIYQNAIRILRLINQLLDMRKIEKNQMTMTFSTVGLSRFFAQIEDSFASMKEKKHIATRIDNELDDDKADIDPNNFDKVIYNVYSNAFKFTPDGGEITTTLAEEDNGQIRIEITDTGCGIPIEQREKVFDRFYQASSANNSSFAGTGIGLHLSRSIVGLHGGQIHAISGPEGVGTSIVITIPRHHEGSVALADVEPVDRLLAVSNTQSATEEKEARQRPATNKRILIVDDETDVNNYLAARLAPRYKVTTCNNGREAYDLLLRQTFDLVVTDVMMPEMDGMTLCHKIKTNININHIPVVMLTAKHSDEDRIQGLLTGADAYIAKPFDFDLLESTIATIVANRDRIMSHMTETSGQMPTIKRVEIKSADEALIEKVTRYIEEHLGDPELNVERLADNVGMSRAHLHRKLKELTNQSARDYIRNIRLKQAGILLGEKKLNISEVAYALGFSNLSHFSTTFKDFYGVSPKEYMNERLGN